VSSQGIEARRPKTTTDTQWQNQRSKPDLVVLAVCCLTFPLKPHQPQPEQKGAQEWHQEAIQAAHKVVEGCTSIRIYNIYSL
jgi:hypothetical protein